MFDKKMYATAAFICCTALSGATLFRNNELAVFLGDSITSMGAPGYLNYMTALYHAHYPGSIRLYCAGIPGDSARRALTRLECDVFARKPDRVFVWFGANDLISKLYRSGRMPLDGKQLEALEVCKKSLLAIYDKLHASGIKVTAVTPAPFHYFNGEKSNFNEAGLANLSDFIIKTAKERGMEYIDLYHPMYEALKKNPRVKTYMKDKCHPDKLGQLLIAYVMLKQMDFDGTVSDVEIDWKTAKAIKAEHAEITGLRKTADGIRFTYAPKRLPFYIAPHHSRIDELVPFSRDMNTEKLCIKGLAPGKYRITAGGCETGIFSSEELADGINIAVLPTPSLRQAEKLGKLCTEIGKNQERLRNIRMYDRHIGFDRLPADPAKRDELVDAFVKKRNSAYRKRTSEEYKKDFRIEPEIAAMVEQGMDNIRKNSLPVPFVIDVKKAQSDQ